MLARRVFDVCIVDEASQITLPATIGALLKARAIVLALPGCGLRPAPPMASYGSMLWRHICW